MTIETAQFVVQRAGVQLKCTGADLATKLQVDDLMAVTRPGDDTYKWITEIPPAGLELTINTEQVTPGNATWGIFSQSNYSLPNTAPKGSVDWGDGTTGNLEDSFGMGSGIRMTYTLEHTYATPGIYTVKATAKGFLSIVGATSNDTINTNYAQMITAYGPADADYEFTQAQFLNTRMTNIGSENINSFDFSKVENLTSAWQYCTGLTSFPDLYAPNATTLIQTFEQCSNLQSIGDITFSSEPTDLGGLFDACRNLTAVPTMSDTSNVFGMSDIAKSCLSIPSWPQLDYSSNQSFGDAFANCQNMVTWGDGSPTPLPELLRANSAWRDCYKLSSFPQCTFPKATTLEYAWNNCTSLTSFPLIDISSSALLSLDYAWKGCSGLTSFPDLDYSSVESMSYAWQNCSELVTWNSNATVDLPECVLLASAWYGCTKLTSIPLLNIPKATSLGYAFYGCQALTSIPFMDTSNVSNWNGAFSLCTSLETIPALDFSSATSITYFCSNTKIQTFPGPLEFGNVTSFSKAFYSAESLTALPYVDTSNGTNFNEIFHFCRALTSIPSTMDFSKGTTFNEGWASCDVLADFPPNMFDVTGTLASNAFNWAFNFCSLTAQSIENILVSLDTNGATNVSLGFPGANNAPKSTWTAAANTAYDNLITKGWTITFNP